MMQIRRATVEDAALLGRLVKPVHDLHVEARPDFFKPYVLTAELIDDFRARLQDITIYCLVAEVDGEAVGYILAQVIVRAENPYTYAIRYLLVDQLSINPERRSKGYGERLMKAVFELAQSLEIKTVSLGVWSFNQRAIAFYERLGFASRDQRMEARLE